MSSTQISQPGVRTQVLVETPIEHAFQVFTAEMGTWWDPDKHILAGELNRMVCEPRVGGHIYDVGTDGSECRWATILAYEPPHRLVFSWNITLAWQIETDPAKCSEVEVRFTAQGEDRTLVELEHRHFERHGEGWEAMRAAVGSPNGWNLVRFAEVAGTRGA